MCSKIYRHILQTLISWWQKTFLYIFNEVRTLVRTGVFDAMIELQNKTYCKALVFITKDAYQHSARHRCVKRSTPNAGPQCNLQKHSILCLLFCYAQQFERIRYTWNFWQQTVYMMHNVQHMYSAAHLKTGRNTITPSLFTCKVKQSNSYTRKITRHNSYSEQNFLKHSDWTVHCLCAPQWNANSNNLHNECEMRCGVSEDNSLRTSILCNKLPLYKSCMWKMWCNWKVKKEGGGGFIHGKVKGFVHCIYRLEMLDAEKKKNIGKKVSTMQNGNDKLSAISWTDGCPD